jgi:hypothetical protein
MSKTWPWNQANGGGVPTSIFGALPATFMLDTPSLGVADLVAFHFTSFNPSILNCTVMGPRSIVYYKVVTEAGRSTTILCDSQSKDSAMLEWHRQPCVEMKGTLPRQKVLEWLVLSSNKSARKMNVNGEQYRWTPYGNDIYVSSQCIFLLRSVRNVLCACWLIIMLFQLTSDDGSRGLGRITKSTGVVTLELTVSASGVFRDRLG